MLFSIVPPLILGVIPARFASSRFPGKPLAVLAGKPMIQHVWERAKQASCLTEVLIATDDERIAETARGFGARVAMTRSDHESGTDRVAEAAAQTEAEIIVNIQGDEPLIDPGAIQTAVLTLLDDAECQMATLMKQISRIEEIQNPNVVKVVTTLDGQALYFSRSLLPHPRGEAVHFKHIGLYVYRRALLLAYSSLTARPPGGSRKTGTAQGAGKRHPHSGCRDKLRDSGRGHARRFDRGRGRPSVGSVLHFIAHPPWLSTSL